MSAFEAAGHDWAAAGWGALPLPAGQKSPPPQGWTGRGAPYPSAADVQAWLDDPEHTGANLGLRLPEGVVGLDVDEYEGKHGLTTLTAASKNWGKLPPAPRITSRISTRSGIYLYRLPAGVSSDRFLGELPGGNVEIIRPEHRYAVGPGSTHPDTGAEYRLLEARPGPQGNAVVRLGVMRREELPELPASWVEGLAVPEKHAVSEPVELVGGRGDAYAQAAVESVVRELQGIASWPEGRTDEKGRGWEKIQADAAYRLASLALADWNSLTMEQAMRAFGEAAPVGGGWSGGDIASKWRSQVRRAEPALPPKDSDDPLSPGYQPPAHLQAAFEEMVSDGTVAVSAGVDDGSAAGVRPGGGNRAAAVDVRPGADAELGVPPRPEGLTDGGDTDSAAGELVPADLAMAVGDGPGAVQLATPLSTQTAAEWVKHSWDDKGNAERVVALFGTRLKYISATDRWMEYIEEEGRWSESKLAGQRAAMEMIDQLPALEGHLYSTRKYEKGKKETSDYEEFLDWCATQRFDAKYRSTSSVLKTTGLLNADPAAFDADPMLLNCLNGVVDLRTGELMKHNPAHLLRRQTPVRFEANAPAPKWLGYIEHAHPAEEMRAYLQRIVGYSITGSTSEQVFFIHQGRPNTGKSVFINVLTHLMGDFARVVPSTTLLAKKNEGHPTEIMGLAGRRLLTTSETPEGARLDAALVKRLSGSDFITARGMGQDFIDFKLAGKIHLVTNHLPHIPDDEALRRRIHIVPWNVVVPPEEVDYDLEDDIIARELPGVLAWAVRGATEWHRGRLGRPPAAHLATLDYFEEEDEFGDFLGEMFAPSEVTWTATKQLFQVYLRWCDSNRVRAMSKIAFGRKMSKKGFRQYHDRTTRGFYCTLRADPINQGVSTPDSFDVDPLAGG